MRILKYPLGHNGDKFQSPGHAHRHRPHNQRMVGNEDRNQNPLPPSEVPGQQPVEGQLCRTETGLGIELGGSFTK